MTGGFLALAGVLAALALVLVLRPLLRASNDAEGRSTLTASVLVVLLLAGAGGLYAVFSNFEWNSPPPTRTPAVEAAALAKRLAKNPDDLQGWLQLGDQYTELQQFPLAARAFARADAVADGRSATAIIGLAEALLSMDFEDIRGRSGRLFDRALEIEPRNLKGLFYGAIAAFARGETDLGRERFQQLLAQDPPENIRLIIEKQLESIDAQQRAAAQAPADADTEAAAGEATVQVHVSVAPHLRYTLTPQATLFVLARDPDQPGPPFAAKRLPVQLPVEVTLSAADAMLEQRRIVAGQRLQIVARISLDGQPQSTSGDPFGQVSYHVGRDGKLNLVIDQLAP